jgi:indole-3-glycerol phosphate synthase
MSTESFLSRIAASTEERVARRKRLRSMEELRALINNQNREPLSFPEAFRAQAHGPRTRVIAEIKRASPSNGAIAPSLDPVKTAADYAAAGAAAISVLTEPEYFGGQIDDFPAIRAAAPKTPLLLKDFVISPYQIHEGRAFGADSVLLIVALLGEERLAALLDVARMEGLEPLVEVHNEAELEIAARLGARVIGINNRDLKTLEVSLETSLRLVRQRPKDAILIAESGLSSPNEIRELRTLGYDGFLIGTHLTRNLKPREALIDLLKETE